MPPKIEPPTTSDTFLERICKALHETPRSLAENIGVSFKDDLQPLLGQRHLLVEIDRDEVWWKVAEYVDKRMGELMAARKEMNRALQRDRAKRSVRMAAMRLREGKARPRRG